MVRPSALQLAERCELAPVLAREFPHTSEAIERGLQVDREVCEALTGGIVSNDPDTVACVNWFADNVDISKGIFVQQYVELRDPDTLNIITAGTPDVVGRDFDEGLVIVDLKKREQWLAGKLAPPDENLQLHAYAIANVLQAKLPNYRTCILLFGDGEVTPLWSRAYTEADWLPFLGRIRKISAHVMHSGGTRPKGFSGPHCTGCYQRSHCPHWMLPALEGVAGGVVAEVTKPGGVTRANADRALILYMQLGEARERLGAMLEAHVEAEGPIPVGEDKQWGPTFCKGRKSADVSALEKAGLHQYVKLGKSYTSFRMTRRQRG